MSATTSDLNSKAAIVERATTALDDAFSDEVKARFGTLCANLAGGEGPSAAAGMFANAMRQLKDAHVTARTIVQKVFGDAG